MRSSLRRGLTSKIVLFTQKSCDSKKLHEVQEEVRKGCGLAHRKGKMTALKSEAQKGGEVNGFSN